MADETLSARIEAEDAASSVIRSFLGELGAMPPLLTATMTAAVAAGTALAAMTALVISSGQAFANQSEEIRKNAIVLGTDTREIEAYSNAAEIAGTSLETLVQASLRVNNVLQQASEGLGKTREELRGYGIDAKALADLPLLEQFDAVAEALRNIPDAGDRARAAVRLLGLSLARELGPALLDNRTQWNALVDDMRTKGAIFDPETTERVARTKESVRLLKQELEDMKNRALTPVVLGFGDFLEKMREIGSLLQKGIRLPTAQELAFGDLGGVDVAGRLAPPPTPAATAVPTQAARASFDEYILMVKNAEDEARNSVLRTREEWRGYFDHIVRVSDESVAHHNAQMQKLPEAVRDARDIITRDFFGREPLPILDLQAFGEATDEARQSLTEIFTEAGAGLVGIQRVAETMRARFGETAQMHAATIRALTKQTADFAVNAWVHAQLEGQKAADVMRDIARSLVADILAELAKIGIKAAVAGLLSLVGAAVGGPAGAAVGTAVGGTVVAGTVPIRRPELGDAPVINARININAGFGTRTELLQSAAIIRSALQELG